MDQHRYVNAATLHWKTEIMEQKVSAKEKFYEEDQWNEDQ